MTKHTAQVHNQAGAHRTNSSARKYITGSTAEHSHEHTDGVHDVRLQQHLDLQRQLQGRRRRQRHGRHLMRAAVQLHEVVGHARHVERYAGHAAQQAELGVAQQERGAQLARVRRQHAVLLLERAAAPQGLPGAGAHRLVLAPQALRLRGQVVHVLLPLHAGLARRQPVRGHAVAPPLLLGGHRGAPRPLRRRRRCNHLGTHEGIKALTCLEVGTVPPLLAVV
ncbi:hypothetical protein PVAP13_9NG676414 [Panicum virgatum]|uniref:Uncharacterized protein n=1 Tax=Panicum virgatum TaxID=38727 RepID=A0A8T0MYY5_PANVG|nr:hypothetical protein PVAP13_9NG676414 [Panicum virgatum]KAG2541333.1 hypothetical protein PVAP13_9NG676414 [Panicum virgatum]